MFELSGKEDSDTDHYMAVAKDRERLEIRKQKTQNLVRRNPSSRN
jgi:hypothetical protein